MPYKKIKLQDLRLDTRYENLKKLSDSEFKKIKKFIDRAKNGESNKGIDISEQTERKLVDALTMSYRNIKKKQLSQLTKKDLTELKQGLKSGKIKSRFKQPYSLASQREMELVLIRFLEFVNPKKYSGFRSWFVVRVPRKTPEYLTEEEIEKLYDACKTNQERFLIAVLFDSGARAGEFLNIRFEDIIYPTANFQFFKIDLKEEYSKTAGRIIGMYWKHSTKAIRDYIQECDKTNQKAQVYPKHYDAVRLFITRLGKRVLKKRIHFHMFRKSSATYYADKINRQQLCYRFGWNFSSDVPDVYINRSGLREEEIKDKFIKSDLEQLEKQNQELETKFALVKEQLGKYAPLLEEIQSNPKIITILSKQSKWKKN